MSNPELYRIFKRYTLPCVFLYTVTVLPLANLRFGPNGLLAAFMLMFVVVMAISFTLFPKQDSLKELFFDREDENEDS